MKFDELEKFILYDMKMDASTGEIKNYQPVMILTLFLNNGVAAKDKIQKKIVERMGWNYQTERCSCDSK